MKRAAIKVRKCWRINPATRTKESAKLYKRSKAKKEVKRLIKEEIR